MSEPTASQMQYQNLKRECDVVGKTHDLLKLGIFKGHLAQDLAISQMYMAGLYKSLLAEVEKQKPALEPLTLDEAFPPVESNSKPVVAESDKASESVNSVS